MSALIMEFLQYTYLWSGHKSKPGHFSKPSFESQYEVYLLNYFFKIPPGFYSCSEAALHNCCINCAKLLLSLDMNLYEV